jgi:hypothetical protein
MDEITKSFSDSIFDKNIEQVAIDAFELGVDAIIKEGIFNDIPFVKTIVSLSKFAINIHDRNMLKQTIQFINEFNNGDISPTVLSKHKEELEKNPKRAEKELTRVIVLLNRHIDLIKSKFLAKLYKKYINEHISWDKFTEYTEMLEMMLESDIITLFDTYTSNGIYDERLINHKHDRLLNIGLLKNVARSSGDYYFIPTDETNPLLMSVSDLGKEFCAIIF